LTERFTIIFTAH